ncbi:hypothetical protein E6C60_0871 [Paenibacillus algicola]|uniref:Uncharacterized protein n=1 Tax=Paenibacillus algicola TaxID=2565926 RepID=A0A4P8XGK4_9BACL|nr:hypothetical protein [Paenibacillus algicola]QCT01592.1 hypothetical protein E6C60_0871 [Paenibacillus algicola]
MGYITLKPPAMKESELSGSSDNELFQHVNPDEITIPYIADANVSTYLDQLVIAPQTFKEANEQGCDIEFGIDMDRDGYITGIELTLLPSKFIALIQSQAFKIYGTIWRDREFHLVTLDHAEHVFKPENVVYKMTDKEDAFVIVEHVEPENLGYHYPDPAHRGTVALFKGLISARDDIYPLEYMREPDFWLKRDM